MATDWSAILDAVDAAILAKASGIDSFKTSAPGGGSLDYKSMSMDELIKLRRRAAKQLWVQGGGIVAEPMRPGIDIARNTDNEDC